MNKIIKICLLSACLLTQQSYAMSAKLLFCGYFFAATTFIPVGILCLSRYPWYINKLKKLKTEFENTTYNFNITEKKHLQLLKEKFNFSELSSEEPSKFYTHQDNSIKEINKITADIPSINSRKKNIESLKNLTSLYEQTIECLEPLEEKKDWSRSEKIQAYDSCFDKALAQQKEK